MGNDVGRSMTIAELIEDGSITKHKDGNHGSNYPRVDEFGDDGVLFLTAKHLNDQTGRIDFASAPRLTHEKARKIKFGYLETNDVLLSHNATVGRVAIVPELEEDVLIGTSLTHFRLNIEKLVPRYLAAFFSGINFRNQLSSVMSHSTRNQVPISAQRKLKIVVPSLPLQQAIASILGSLDDKIELNRRMNETLDSMSRAIFENRFIDAVTVLTAAQEAELPVHWELKTVSEILADERGISVGVMYPGKHDPDGVPLIKAGDLSGGFLNRNPSFRVTPAKHREYRRTEFRGGEILMTLVGNLGQCAIVPPEMQGWNAARAVAVIRVADASSVAFVKQWLESRPIQDLMHAWANTTVQPTLNLKEIRKLPIFWPPDQVRSEFADAVEPMMLRVNANIRESSKLAALRDTLLPKLLSGELPIPDALKQAEAVL